MNLQAEMFLNRQQVHQMNLTIELNALRTQLNMPAEGGTVGLLT
jgi:hypothetical protein